MHLFSLRFWEVMVGGLERDCGLHFRCGRSWDGRGALGRGRGSKADKNRMLSKTRDYLDHFARFKRKENVEAVERLLSAHKELAKFERAQLGMLRACEHLPSTTLRRNFTTRPRARGRQRKHQANFRDRKFMLRHGRRSKDSGSESAGQDLG
jgi:hypothetical protein